jgi:hypothetical protein
VIPNSNLKTLKITALFDEVEVAAPSKIITQQGFPK